MIKSKRFFSAGMDGDNAEQMMADEAFLNLQNARMAISQFGRDARIENLQGTTLIPNNKISGYGVNQCIGSCIDNARNRLIFFLYNTLGNHGIYCYDIPNATMYAVFYDSQVTGGLGFSKTSRIDRDASVVGDFLYWTDDLNEPKKLNIESGIKLNQTSYVTDQPSYSAFTDSYEMTVIRRPPVFAPSIAKDTDSAFENNFIERQSFQFAWQYVYFDGEVSTLSEFSTASKFNGILETYNFIRTTLSSLETIPQTARIIRLIVKPQNNNANSIGFVARSWDKLISADNTAIANHNAASTQLSFDFYANILGETIDSATMVKPYDSVPLLSKTLSLGKQRLFLANNLSGYDTPTSTSMSLTTTTTTVGASIVSDLLWLELAATDEPMLGNFYLGAYMVFLDSGVPQAGYYYILGTKTESTVSQPPFGSPVPTTGDFNTDLAFMGYYLSDVATYWGYRSPTGGYNEQNYQDALTDYTVTGLSNSAFTAFKAGADVQTGIVFFDKALRKCGVVTNSGLIVSIDNRTFTGTTATSLINWTLSNGSASSEIPAWAYYYAPVRTLNQRTRFFIESFAAVVKYATKDADGAYVFTGTTFTADTVGIAIDTTPLVQSKLGYTFQDGDVCALTSDTNVLYTLPVLAQEGKWIILKAEDIGSVATETFIYEIYTPYIRTENEAFYEVGQMYKITNPTASNRTYSTLSGSFFGDTFYITRVYNGTFYNVEAMNPNDAYYQLWNTDVGRPNFVTLLGQERNETEVRYSNVYVSGTLNNGLSSFDALNYSNVPEECGGIQKLQLASKVQSEGQGLIMLAICYNQTASLYLGEVQVVGASQNAFLASSPNVIGTINVLKGNFGTQHAESVIEYLGQVYWLDINNGVAVQYSANGLFPISSFKMSRYFKNYAKGYLASNANNLDNINGFHHLPTAIDPFHKEFLSTNPALIYQNYATTLPSYSVVPSYATSIINRFDIYDQLGKTMAFSIAENKWGSNYEFLGEWYEYCQNTMFSFKNGALYTHDTDTVNYNRFYGVQYPMRLCFVQNNPPNGVKDVFDISFEANVIPNYTVLYAAYPNVQITDLASTDTVWKNQEGVMYARFYRDRLSPNTSGSTTIKMMQGDVVKSATPKIMAEFQCYTGLIYINFCSIGFSISKGQQDLLPK